MPPQCDDGPTTPRSLPDDPKPDDDGSYKCDLCHQKVRVGGGGAKNFMQHRGSSACLKAATTKKKPQAIQMKTLTSFFSKVTHNHNTAVAPTGVSTCATSVSADDRSSVAHTPSLPQSSLQSSTLLCQSNIQRSLSIESNGRPLPDAYALELLARLDHAAQELPIHIPEAEVHDEIACVLSVGEPDDPSEAWEYLDPMLNRLIGYGSSVEDVAQRVRRGPLGIEGLGRLIHRFVVHHGVTGDLLEGKLGTLLKAIELLKERAITRVPPTEWPSQQMPTPCTTSQTHFSSLPQVPLSINSDDDDDIEYIGAAPSSLSPTNNPLPTLPLQSLSFPGTPVVNDIAERGVSKREACRRHLVSVPPGQTAIGAYPFMLHIEEHIPWEFSSLHGSLLLHARNCEDRHLDKGGLCRPCQSLLLSDRFRKTLSRVQEGVREYTPYKYYGLVNLAEIARKKEHTIEMYRTRRVNDTRKLLGREGAIALHHQILLAMSTGKIPRVDRILRIASDRRMSVATILEMVKRAGEGIFRPKGFKEEEDLQTLLFLRLGGRRVAEMAHRMFGIPAPSTVRRCTMIPPLICSASYPLEAELVNNLKAGLERKTTMMRCMEFNSVADAELLLQDVNCGDVHLAHEATVGAIGILCSNSRLYCARPFLISGSCKKETAEDHAVLIQTALNAINQLKALSNARVVCIASDGEARRGKALVQLTFKRTLLASSPIYPWLSACNLLDLHVGDDEMTCDKDWKHAGAKRPRNALLREKGVLVYGTWITPTVLRSHLFAAGHICETNSEHLLQSQMHKLDHIQAVLNPNDKQDVLLTFNLLRDALRIFGSMCYHLLVPYICVDLSLEDQLEYLSYAGHLALVLYAHRNACGNFLPTALYVDLTLMIKNVFFCVAKAKVDTPEEDFSIVLLGTDRLENLFGCLRTMVGNDANIDNFQLGARLTGTMESANILALHPEWDKAPRRLHLPLISKDMTTIPDAADHISPCSWRGSQLEADYPFASEVLRAVEATPNASLLAPFGTLLVHASLSTDDIEDSSHDDVLHGLAPDAITQDYTDDPIIGDGMCELEDAATALEWAPNDHAFSNVVELADN
ncbi:hypothetical protein EDB84DRAFT_1557861 [Lactarius hengduanensis]|nr:hypothetical protein EDB84DRAFT_1557861 [Lactarius hengduanensis]